MIKHNELTHNNKFISQYYNNIIICVETGAVFWVLKQPVKILANTHLHTRTNRYIIIIMYLNIAGTCSDYNNMSSVHY